jgi:RNA polymerase nonessential primary-like sigma factor
VSFVSYAWYWIEDAIRREISNRGRTISIPENVISDVRRFRKDHAGKLRGGDPILDAGSLARMLNYPEEKWRRLSRAEYVFISEGDYQTDNESSGNMKGLAAPHAEDPVEVADAQTRADHLRQLLTKLPRRERHVIEQFYGLVEGQPPLTTLQLAQGMRISAERVRQIRIRALALLQFYSQSQLSQAATKPASKRWLATGSFRFIDALDDPKPNTK